MPKQNNNNHPCYFWIRLVLSSDVPFCCWCCFCCRCFFVKAASRSDGLSGIAQCCTHLLVWTKIMH